MSMSIGEAEVPLLNNTANFYFGFEKLYMMNKALSCFNVDHIIALMLSQKEVRNVFSGP